jgi:endonuclease YncB( thermonuclease family)
MAGCSVLNAAGIAIAQSAEAPSADESGLSPPETREVAEVIDASSLRLADGDMLRLLAIDTPESEPELSRAGRKTLVEAIARQPIALRYDAVRRDRYGRRLAHAFTADGLWLQAELVKKGLARVHGDSRNRCGLRKLMAFEAGARDRKSGLWRLPAFAVRAATDGGLHRLAGRFQIVEGKVVESAVVRGFGYLNFGPDHATDFTLVLDKPALAAAAAAGLDIAGLAGAQIRCRGWLEVFDGPRIQVTYPEQIEALGN